jgi:hypothetical protein
LLTAVSAFWWLSAAAVLEQICGRYGCDLLLRLEAKTLGVWSTHTTFSHQAGEFRLIPSADSLNGSALCTQRAYSDGVGCFSDALFLDHSGAGLVQRRTYWDGSIIVAQTTREYAFGYCSPADAVGTPTKQRRNLVTGSPADAAAAVRALGRDGEGRRPRGCRVTSAGAHEVGSGLYPIVTTLQYSSTTLYQFYHHIR